MNTKGQNVKLVLKNGTKIELVNHGELEKSNRGHMEFVPDSNLWAIPGGAVRTTSQIATWAEKNGAKVG